MDNKKVEKQQRKERIISELMRVVVWFALWQLAAMFISLKVPFAGPVDTIQVLWKSLHDKVFYDAVWSTFSGIALGFLVAMILGTGIGYVAFYHKNVDFFLTPVVDFCRYIPMISFTLLALLWSGSEIIAFEVSLFLSFPVIYKHTLTGLRNSNQHYLKRAKEIKMPLWKKIIYMYQPVAMPEYLAGCHRALNMCWKSGVIAQILGDTRHSIGSMLSEAQSREDVASIFAWTVVIVAISVAFEQVVIRMLSMDRYNAGRVNIEDVFEQLSDEEINL